MGLKSDGNKESMAQQGYDDDGREEGAVDEGGEEDDKEKEVGDEGMTDIKGEDMEETEEDEEKQDEPLENPSTDIKGDLAQILSEDSSVKGSFAFHHSYPEAPNPTLYLDGLGHIGLPLSIRDAEAIKSRANQAPFGTGERTVVDKSVRDTWELDASQVRFDNPAWDPFLKRVVQEICTTLGVNIAASEPRCELYKLLLYETGSHFLPHVDTEKADGMFATIVVVPPSKFKGGSLHVSHGSLSTVYDCSPKSLTETNVLAWYTDVMHEVKLSRLDGD